MCYLTQDDALQVKPFAYDRYFLYIHFKYYPESSLYPPYALLPKAPTPTSWPWHSPVLGHIKYYSAIKNNEFIKFLGKWIYVEDIILSEITQSENKSLAMHSLISGY